MRPASKSEAAHANYANPNIHLATISIYHQSLKWKAIITMKLLERKARQVALSNILSVSGGDSF